MSDEGERKYEILPGVKLPDVKQLKEASSNFEESGVEDVVIRTTGHITDERGTPDRATLEEIKRLQELGEEVAENEERAAEESRRKMQAIMERAVTQSASLDDLKQSAKQSATGEKLAEIEQRQKEIDAKQAEEDEKKRMREERRAMQKKQLEDARARAQGTANAAEQADNPEASDIEITVDEQEPAEEASVAPEATAAEEAVVAEAVAEIIDEPAIEEPIEEAVQEPVQEAVEESVEITVDPEPAAEPEPETPDIAIEPDVDIDATGVISSDEETMEDFGEFLDGGDNKN